MYAVIEEAATAPTEALWWRLRLASGNAYGKDASAEYKARADARFAPIREGVEKRQKRANVSEAVRRWIDHIAGLAAKVANGWRPLLNELTPAEWRGLELWRNARERFADGHVKCPGCGRAIPRGQSADACGWSEKK